jgi:hypothetical protein
MEERLRGDDPLLVPLSRSGNTPLSHRTESQSLVSIQYKDGQYSKLAKEPKLSPGISGTSIQKACRKACRNVCRSAYCHGFLLQCIRGLVGI